MTRSPSHQVVLPLEPEDHKKLRKQLIPVIVFSFIIAGIFFLISTFVFKDMGDGFFTEGITLYMMIGFGMFFMGVIGYMIWSFVYDIRHGIKHCIKGTVTDKQLNIQSKGHTGTGNSRSKNTTRYYYIFIDEVKYKIDNAGYNQVLQE